MPQAVIKFTSAVIMDRQQRLTYTTIPCPLKGVQQPLSRSNELYNCWKQHCKNKENIL